MQQAKLPVRALTEAKAISEQIRAHQPPLGVGVRSLVSWAIGASRPGGPLTEAQGKKLAIAAVRVCRDLQDQAGTERKARGTPLDKLIREYGVVALFNRNETVRLAEDDRPYIVLSVSRAKGSIVVAPVDNLQETFDVDPRELRKDPVEGIWPAELMDL